LSSNRIVKLFVENPTVEEMIALATGEIEAVYPCDRCLKDCKKERGVSFVMVRCKDAVYEEKEDRC